MVDRARMVAVVRLAIIKHVRDHYMVSSADLARDVVEAIEREEIEEFEREHLKSLETAYGEKYGELPF